MTEPVLPENYDEIEAVVDLLFGDHPELETVGDVRRAATERIKEMRAADVPVHYDHADRAFDTWAGMGEC